ncbi:MAG: hypothetical protein HY909_09295 [Deltaproteobacteria bacterium]|nr:hypothetical protein [Deltaproteobacteria bacterium]
MRRYNQTVYRDGVDGTTEQFTSATHNELLGSADVFILQWRGTRVGGTAPKVTVVLYGSDNGTDWINRETLVNLATLTAGQLNTGVAESTTKTMAFARLGISLTGTLPTADIEVIVCGRDA